MKYYCFNITTECNMECSFCYRIGKTIGTVDVEKAFRYIDFLVLDGCTNINISGGEPLLHPKWREIIQYCALKGLYIIISTNGLLLNLHDPYLKYIKRICIPLDCLSNDAKSMMRPAEQVRKAQLIIQEYCNNSFDFKLKVNTIVTKQNMSQLDEIFSIVNHQGIDWKLFELREKGYFYRYSKSNVMPSEAFSKIVSCFIERERECNIFYSGTAINSHLYERQSDPYVLNYNGDLYLTKQIDDCFIKNIDKDK